MFVVLNGDWLVDFIHLIALLLFLAYVPQIVASDCGVPVCGTNLSLSVPYSAFCFKGLGF